MEALDTSVILETVDLDGDTLEIPGASALFGSDAFADHEQVVFCSDQRTGLRAIIGIHSTALGPALGGTRMWTYPDENEAIRDVLRLSRGMTLKSSISGLPLGGGKAVIIGDSRRHKNDRLMAKFGEFIDTLGGRYITAEDVGMSAHDMEVIRTRTKHVSGLPEEMGGSGDPSPVTAYGVYLGMKAAVGHRYGNDSLSGMRILVDGVGRVGRALLPHLCNEGAEIWVHDIHEATVREVTARHKVRACDGSRLYHQDFDIYAPCALGGVLNRQTIPRLKCSIVAGAANNQLADESADAALLVERGITYAPDFVVNAGGLISVYSEIAGSSRDEVMRQTEGIYDSTRNILRTSEDRKTTPHEAALAIAQARVDEARQSMSASPFVTKFD